MPLSERENYLRSVTMTGPEWIPMRVAISGAVWKQFGREMEEVCLRHPTIFPNFEPGSWKRFSENFGDRHRAGERSSDRWGCVWTDLIDGLEGQVVEHPLAEWSALDGLPAPDPERVNDWGPIDWQARREQGERARAAGRLVAGDVSHGFLFMRLFYLRGFENFMTDLATGPPELRRLIDLVTAFNLKIVRRWLEMRVELMSFGDDLGSQTASMIGPRWFARWIAPAYRALMQPCRRAGVHVFLHSDGYIMDLMDLLIDCGVTIVNPQDLVNGIDNLVREVKGRVSICLDVDRQRIVPFGSQAEIRDLVEEEVRKLGSPAGGLQLIAGIYPPTPPENVEALCQAMETFRTYWS